MTLPEISLLKQRGSEALAPHCQRAKKLITLHTVAVLALNFLVLLMTVLWDRGIVSTDGLRGMQTRSILTTVQLVLEYAMLILLPFWQISWLYVVLKFYRGNRAETSDFLTGFRKLGPVLRLTILKSLIFTGLIFAGVYAGYFVILATPLANPLMEVIATSTDPEAMYDAAMLAMEQIEVPILLIGCGISLLLCIPFFYRFRLAEYFLLDNPDFGARAALRASRRMMRGNAWRMAKLDLSFWWFWLLSVLTAAIAYADLLLPLLGVNLPIPEDIAFIGAFVLSAPAQLLLYRGCKLRVDTTYAAAYEALIPPAQPSVSVSFPAPQE